MTNREAAWAVLLAILSGALGVLPFGCFGWFVGMLVIYLALDARSTRSREPHDYRSLASFGLLLTAIASLLVGTTASFVVGYSSEDVVLAAQPMPTRPVEASLVVKHGQSERTMTATGIFSADTLKSLKAGDTVTIWWSPRSPTEVVRLKHNGRVIIRNVLDPRDDIRKMGPAILGIPLAFLGLVLLTSAQVRRARGLAGGTR